MQAWPSFTTQARGQGPGRVGGTPSSGWCAPSLLQMVRARARVPVRLPTNGPHRGSWHRRGAGELALGGEGSPAPATLEGRLIWGRQRQLRPLFRLRRTGKETTLFPPAKSQPRQVQFTMVAMSTLSGNDPDRYQKQKKAAAARARREQAKIEKRSAEMAAAAAEAVAAAGSKRRREAKTRPI